MVKEFNARDLSNMLITSPFTKSGVEAYNKLHHVFNKPKLSSAEWKKVYLEKIYTYPWFLNDKIIDVPEDYYKYKAFEENILNAVKPLYLIIGPSGSGKTHFAHKILSQNTNAHVFYVNFETMTSDSIKFMGDITFAVKHRNPINHTILTLVEKIGECFIQNDNELYIQSLFTAYNDCFSRDDDIVNMFFKKMQMHKNNMKKNLLKFLIDSVINGSNECIISYETDFTEMEYEKISKTIENLVGILLRLYFCMTRIESNYKNKNIFLYIDNIERFLGNYSINTNKFIPESAITDSHFSVILKSLISASFHYSNRITDIANQPCSGAILLTARESTDGILEPIIRKRLDMQEGKLNPIARVLITDWFDNEEVYNRRVCFFTGGENLQKYLKDKDIQKTTAIDTYFNIIKDKSESRWALNKFIDDFYNRSKFDIYERFVGDFLSMCEKKTIKYLDNNCNVLLFFNTEWKNAKYFNHDEYLHLCRRYIIHFLLAYVNNKKGIHKKNDFESFLHHNLTNDEECSYARRILSCLRKNELSSKGVNIFESELFTRVPDLIKDLKISNEKIKSFSDVLWRLNLSWDVDTYWTGLIYIEVPGGILFLENKLNEMIEYDKFNYELYKGKNNDKQRKVEVKITYAGSIYLFLMPDYMYYSCRYAKNSYPLLLMSEKLVLEENLKIVISNVKLCIKKIIEIEKYIPSTVKNNWSYSELNEFFEEDTKNFCELVIQRHIDYLKNYYNYLRSKHCILGNKNSMAMTVQNTINDYEKFRDDELFGSAVLNTK